MDRGHEVNAMTGIADIDRPPRALCDALAAIGTATASGELSLMGIRDPQIRGPVPLNPGRAVAGPALTLQCMPKREDLYGSREYDNPELQLHRHVLYPAQAGDMVVVDARGDMASGIFGEMMLTFFAGRGGAGVVVDGCIRDSAKAKQLDLGIWVRGVTPNYHAQTNIIPFAVNVPVACGNVLVMPGDIVVADDDGVLALPAPMGASVADAAAKRLDNEAATRRRLADGTLGVDLYHLRPLLAELGVRYVDRLPDGGET
jgi:regulator of RNase E activity RraA